MFKKIIVSSVFCLSLMPGAALAHGGHAKDPHHLHQQIAETEVTLQYLSAKAYLGQLQQQKLKVPDGFDNKQPVLLVLLEGPQGQLDTRVKLKITDANGKTVGDAKGITPISVKHSRGTYYFTQQTLPKNKLLVMVQFMGAKGIQRAGFSLVP
jgi:hypothetical protein